MAQQQGQAPYPTTIQPPAHHHVHHPYPPQHHPHIPYIPPSQPHPPFQTTYSYAQQYHHTPHQFGSVPGPTMPPMAHHQHHQYPPQIPPYYPGSGSGSARTSSKRPREAPVSDPELGPSTKRQAVGNDVLFRVLVPASQIGMVIGKGGHRVQKVRDDTKATVKIADPIARYEERVIIISSKANDGAVTDAEKALLEIALLILADDGTPAASQTLNLYAGASAADAPANSVKLLIAGSQAGGLIGVSGQNIEKLRSSSGATISVLSPNQLPLCASAQESDRLVQISGEVSSVIKAVEEIGIELRTNPPSEVISISPTYNLSIARVAQSYMDPHAAEYVTLDMVISETMVGGLIGRSGSNIARIRNESGAMIKVIGGKGEQKHRQIQLIGTAQQVALAKQRVDEYIYSQLTQ